MPNVPLRTNPLHVPKPERGWHYRWIADDQERLAGHQLGHGDSPGYHIVRGDTVPATREVAQKHGLPDAYVNELYNRIQYGRLILARIPEAEARRRVRERHADLMDRLQVSLEEYQDKANRRGIRPFGLEGSADDVEKEISDRKRHAQTGGSDRVSSPGVPPEVEKIVNAPVKERRR